LTTGKRSFDEAVRSNERSCCGALMLSGGVHARGLVQTVLARAIGVDRIGGLEHPDAYLRTMVVKRVSSAGAGCCGMRTAAGRVAEQPTGEDIGLRQAATDAAWRMLAETAPPATRSMVLRFYEDLPDDEIAAVTGCSASTVRHAAPAAASGRPAARRGGALR